MTHTRNEGSVILDVERLSFRAQDDKVLVDAVSFHVHEGETVVIAGPNGAGKTTLIRMIAGLLNPTFGRAMIAGRPLADLSPVERARRIAFAGQFDEPDGRLTVAEYIMLGRIPHRGRVVQAEHARAFDRAVTITGMACFLRQSVGRLSGGERQRAHIARAICQEPDLLILDEPTNHLDPGARGEVLSIVGELGITVIAVLHDLVLIPPFASHVALMERGKLAAYGHPDIALSRAAVRSVFGVDLLRLAHPEEDRELPFLDIPLRTASRPAPTINLQSEPTP